MKIDDVLDLLPESLQDDATTLALISAIAPYIGAIIQITKEELAAVIKSITDDDWLEVNKRLQPMMTVAERLELNKAKHKDSIAYLKAAFARKKLAQEIAVKVAIGLLGALLL